MSRASVDPQELQRFAHHLKQFNGELRGQVAAIHRRFQQLGETWQDQEQERFAEEFGEMVRVLTRFADLSERQVPVLLRKAAAIQAYLGER